MLEVYIGLNGYGKINRLKHIKQNLIDSVIISNEILFLYLKLLLIDEVKDIKDSSKMIKYILTELLSILAIETRIIIKNHYNIQRNFLCSIRFNIISNKRYL